MLMLMSSMLFDACAGRLILYSKARVASRLVRRKQGKNLESNDLFRSPKVSLYFYFFSLTLLYSLPLPLPSSLFLRSVNFLFIARRPATRLLH